MDFNLSMWNTGTCKGYTLNTIFPSNPENVKIQASKLVKGMKHAIMRNGEYTSKMYTLHEGVHKKNVLPPFLTRFLRLASSAICDIWALGFL